MTNKSIKGFIIVIIGLLSSINTGFAQDLRLIIPKGHTNTVTHFITTADHKYVLSADGSNEVVVWDYASGKQITNLSVSGAVTAITEHSETLLIGLRNGSVLKFDPNHFGLSSVLSYSNSIVDLIIYNDNVIAITSSGGLQFFNKNGNRVDSIKTALNPSKAELINNQLYIGTADGNLSVINLDTREITQPIEIGASAINDIKYLPSKNLIGIADNRGMVSIVDRTTLTILSSNQLFGFRVRGFFFDSDSTLLAVGRDDQTNFKQLNINNGKISNRSIWENQSTYGSFGLGLYAIMPDLGSGYFLPGYEQNFYRIDSLGNKIEYKGEAGVINHIAVDPEGILLAVASARNEVQVIDLTGRTYPKQHTLNSSPTSLQWVGHTLYTGLANGQSAQINSDSVIYWNPDMVAEYPTSPLEINKEETLLVRKFNPSQLHVYTLSDKSVKKVIKKAGFEYELHPSKNELLVVNSKRQLERWSEEKLKRTMVYEPSDLSQFTITKQGTEIVTLSPNTISKLNFETGEVLASFSTTTAGATNFYASPDGEQLFLTYASREKGSTVTEYYIQVINGETDKVTFKLEGHNSTIKDISFIKGGKFILTASADGTIKIWNRNGNFLGDLIPLANGQHVFVAEDGLFDASSLAMKKLAYLQKDEVILLDQVKDRYYEPGLLSKTLGFNSEKKREVPPLNHIKLYPEFELLHPMKNKGVLGVKVKPRDGGVGRIIVLINGKEIDNKQSAVVDSLTEFDIKNHPYLLIGDLNKISVKVYNETMDAVSQPRNLYYLDKQKPEDIKPKLFGLVIGVSDYRGNHLDLKYAAKDAQDIASAISISSREYLGQENVNVRLMTTLADSASNEWPSKANITNALTEIAEKTTARDILFLYISGHGEVDEENTNEFYYLTADAGNGDIGNSDFRKEALISNYELFKFLQNMPTLKQVLIIDACHSGSLVESLSVSTNVTMGSTQIRSLEQLKDRANVYVLAGSAADAVSYESSIYGQGLLTYSLLMGMKGAALRENQYVDILQLFSYASNEVPMLAKEVGGIQKPEIKIPSSGSFDIGLLNDESKRSITVNSPKPLFIHSLFQQDVSYFDELNLGSSVDKKLRLMDSASDIDVVFLNTNEYEDAFAIRGRYTVSAKGEIDVSIKLFKNRGQVGDFKVKAESVESATEQIIIGVLSRIKPILKD